MVTDVQSCPHGICLFSLWFMESTKARQADSVNSHLKVLGTYKEGRIHRLCLWSSQFIWEVKINSKRAVSEQQANTENPCM